MDTGTGATNGNGSHADPTPHDATSTGGSGNGAPAAKPTNGSAAGTPPAKKDGKFKPGQAANPGGLTKAAREGQRRMAKTARTATWVYDEKLARYRRAKKNERGGALTTEAAIMERALNAKDNGKTLATLMDKLYPSATPIAAQVQISNTVPVSNNQTNDARQRITPQLADPGVRRGILGLINAMDDAGGYSRNAGEVRN